MAVLGQLLGERTLGQVIPGTEEDGSKNYALGTSGNQLQFHY